jgi:Fe-S-cluster-containing dehydrogenase component
MTRDTRSFGMAVDVTTCVGCAACVIACKTENGVADGFSRDWIVTETNGAFPNLEMTIQSERCHHCAAAPCITSCPTGASHYGPGGIVLVTADKCTGCKACIASCPYGARFIDPNTGTIDKCTFCAHRVDNDEYTTACQEVCPTDSIVFGDLNDPASEVSRRIEKQESYTLMPDAGTRPKLYFLS